MNSTLYPTSPQNLDPKFTKLSGSYHLKSILAILSIVLFFALYFALIYAFVELLLYVIFFDIKVYNIHTILLWGGAIFGAGMLLVFTVKFIFKLKNHVPPNRIKLDFKEYPELVEFIHQICKETGAPKPKRIYVDPDVNAYVKYTNTWMSLIFPTRKELTIGMGLLSTLNLTEFKAVMTHEFGHFAQRSMKVGSYIMSANTIIHDMIYQRDAWDETLAQWRGADIRLSAAAWLITPVIWIVRQLLSLFYMFLNLMNSLLSREMEFNADKYAVKLTGSEAIVSALWKLDAGNQVWTNVMNNAYLFGNNGSFVKNLYHHNDVAMQKAKPEIDKAHQELPEHQKGGKHFFNSSEHSHVSMYASHPPNDKREQNAKEPFVEGVQDDRSPWLLFGDKEKLQEKMTSLIYEQYFNKKPETFESPEAFQEFIKAESLGTELLEEYANTFTNRYITIPEEEKLMSHSSEGDSIEKLKEEIKELMKPVQAIEKIMIDIEMMMQGAKKPADIEYKSLNYGKNRLMDLYNMCGKDREELFLDAFVDWDKRFIGFHYNLAYYQKKHNELMALYKQQDAIIKTYKSMSGNRNRIMEDIERLQENSETTHAEVLALSDKIKDRFKMMNQDLEDTFKDFPFVPIPNIETVEKLKLAMVEKGKFTVGIGNIFENGNINTMIQDLENSLVLAQRVDQKNMASILLFQKELREVEKSSEA